MERREIHFDDFAAVLAEADRLLADSYRRGGNWSLAQVCEHLATVITMSLDGFPWRMPWVVRLGARWLALGTILRRKVIRRTFSAPAYMLPTADAGDRDAVERLRTAVARFVAHEGPLQPSPVFGTLSREQWRAVHLWHCEHHFSFLHPL